MSRARSRIPSDSERHAASWAVTLVVVLAVAVMVSTGCAVPAKALEQLRVDTAAADNVSRNWPTITQAERKAAYLMLREGAWVLRNTFSGDLPEDPALRAKILEMRGDDE